MPINIPSGNHYFHRVGDESQTNTAQRASFRPSFSNKIANRFLKSENPKMQKIGNVFKNLRAADLNTRASVRNGLTSTYKKGINLRASMDKDYASSRRDEKIAAVDDRNDTMQTRYDYKKKINAAAGKDMQQEIDSSNDKLQSRLTGKGYVASGGLAQQKVAGNKPAHFSNDEFHRFSASYSEAPSFGKSIAQGFSARHDAGISGVRRAAMRGAQYGAVGVANAVQLTKQGIYTAAKKVAPQQSEEEGTFERHANKARDMRKLNSASLGGNQAFAQKFSAINKERQQSIEDQADKLGYGIAPDHPDSGGVPVPRTHYMARKFNNYFGGRNPALAGADVDRSETSSVSEKDAEIASDNGAPAPPAMEKRKKMARVFVSLTTFSGNQRLKGYEAGYAKYADKFNAGDRSEKTLQKLQNYDAKRFNARFKIETMSAAVDGKMQDKIAELTQSRVDVDQEYSEKKWHGDDASSENGSVDHDKLFDMDAYQEDARSVDLNGLKSSRAPSEVDSSGASYEESMASFGVRLGPQFSSPTFGARKVSGGADDISEMGADDSVQSKDDDFVSAFDPDEDLYAAEAAPRRNDGLTGEFGNRTNGDVNRT